MELGGQWQAAEADEDLRRRHPDPDLDDSGWAPLKVPGHWRSSEAFAGSDGPLLLRRRFEAAKPDPDRRWWLTFEGIFYQSDIWLDGSYVGDTEGYFFPHTFEVTSQLRDRTDHVLGVDLSCAPQRNRKAKRNLTGVFQHWDCLDPDWNPGGIWRPVRLGDTGSVRIERLRVLCPRASPERAVIALRAVLDAARATTVEVTTRVGSLVEHVRSRRLAQGLNRMQWRVAVDRPPLWWPHALGQPELVDVSVDVRISGQATEVAPSDHRVVRTGLRQVRMRRWIATVNGERLFLKGTNQGPSRMALADASPQDLEHDVVLARQAGLDLLRMHAHVGRRETYQAADRQGLLVWQDLPLQWGYDRGVRTQAVRQAREAVDLLGGHPSVALWCAHNEPIALDIEPGLQTTDAGSAARLVMTGMILPSWNKTLLDSSLRRALERSDRSRPVKARSGIPPSDSHLYFGWYHGQEADLARVAALWPRLVQFVSEFGAQAVPDSDDFLEPHLWPDLDWERLGRHHALQKVVFERNGLAPAGYPTLADWRGATQRYQATLIRRQIEELRRLKYRPAGGFAQFCFADGHPGVTWSVLDHARRPKLSYDALVAACAPVIVVADRPSPTYAPGDALSLDVHVVSDQRRPLLGLTAVARLSWEGDEHRRAWRGDVPGDACVRAGTLQAVIPPVPGRLDLELELSGAGVQATNHYESRITAV